MGLWRPAFDAPLDWAKADDAILDYSPLAAAEEIARIHEDLDALDRADRFGESPVHGGRQISRGGVARDWISVLRRCAYRTQRVVGFTADRTVREIYVSPHGGTSPRQVCRKAGFVVAAIYEDGGFRTILSDVE